MTSPSKGESEVGLKDHLEEAPVSNADVIRGAIDEIRECREDGYSWRNIADAIQKEYDLIVTPDYVRRVVLAADSKMV